MPRDPTPLPPPRVPAPLVLLLVAGVAVAAGTWMTGLRASAWPTFSIAEQWRAIQDDVEALARGFIPDLPTNAPLEEQRLREREAANLRALQAQEDDVAETIDRIHDALAAEAQWQQQMDAALYSPQAYRSVSDAVRERFRKLIRPIKMDDRELQDLARHLMLRESFLHSALIGHDANFQLRPQDLQFFETARAHVDEAKADYDEKLRTLPTLLAEARR